VWITTTRIRYAVPTPYYIWWFVLGIEGAKAAKMRQRRVEKAITDLRGGGVSGLNVGLR